jgi:glycosyltransferase involved in cell wall biosynthesis
MRICIVSPYSPLAVTGIGTFISELARTLKKTNQDCVVLAPTTEIPFADQDSLEVKEHLRQISTDRFPIFRNLFLAILSALFVLRQRRSFDVIHVQQPHLQSVLVAMTGKLLGIAVVATYHLKVPSPEGLMRKAIMFLVEKGLPRFCDRVVFVSYAAKKDFLLLGGSVIWNGVDTERFHPNEPSELEMRKRLNLGTEVVFLFGSRWAKIKGIDETLKAFQKALSRTKSKIVLVLTGGGERRFEDEVRSDIKALGLEGSVKAVGRVKEMIGYYHLSDVFLLPSFSEGLPIALLEGMSSGLAPIASSVGGNTEVIRDGVDGLLVNAGDIEDLCDKIQGLADDSDLREKLAKEARNRIEHQFSLEKMTQRYVKVYESSLRKSAAMSSSKQN